VIVRLLALLIALSTGVTGILPAGDGSRCVIMNQRMSPGADCCPKCRPPAVASIGAPCCEVVHGATLEARAPQSVDAPRIHPAPLAAILPLATAATVDLARTAVNFGSRLDGRPPGDQLHQLSQVLRV
jgi:hypothetical protein